MQTILFQGDSITDAQRNYTDDFYGGMGYATMCAGDLGFRYPEQYKVLNRGISGNRVVDLYARWKVDCLNLKPDVLSILIGVNDVWHELGQQNGVCGKRFKDLYTMLIEDTLEALPNIKIMLLEPFLMRSRDTEEQWDIFYEEVKIRAAVTKEVAESFDLPFVPLQSVFDQAVQKTSVDQWTRDGVHPSAAGHRLMANEWLRCFEANMR